MSRRSLITLSGLSLGLLVHVACMSSSARSSSEFGGTDGLGVGASTGVGTGGTTALPPELELELDYSAPVVLGKRLFTANPDRDRVAVVDSETLSIESYGAGNSPERLAVIPAGKTDGGVLVLNRLSQDATLLMNSASSAELAKTTLALQPGASAISVSATGAYAVVWSKSSDGLLGTEDGYQDLTVVSLGKSPKTTRLSVGYRPTEVFISSDEKHAYVVCEPGITVLALDGDEPRVEQEIFLEGSSKTRDVEFSADGALALVRSEGSQNLLGVKTATGEQLSVALPKVITDLDVSNDGKRAWAVMRSDGESEVFGSAGATSSDLNDSLVARISLDSFFTNPDAYEVTALDGLFGSVSLSRDGSVGVLFSNASSDTQVAILGEGSSAPRYVDVQSNVLSVLTSEDGEYGVAILGAQSAKKRGAFALVPLKKLLPARVEATDAPPKSVAIDPQNRGALIATDGGSGPSTAYFGQFPGLFVDAIPLDSRPLLTGMVPESGRGFVAQSHPEGRILFLNLNTLDRKTLTGFELQSKVVH